MMTVYVRKLWLNDFFISPERFAPTAAAKLLKIAYLKLVILFPSLNCGGREFYCFADRAARG